MSGDTPSPQLLALLERIAIAIEASVEASQRAAEATLMLLDEMTSEPDEGEQGDSYLDGTPKD